MLVKPDCAQTHERAFILLAYLKEAINKIIRVRTYID